MTQAKSRPPHFVLFGNQLDELPTSYERFLINGLRKTFDLPGVPIRISKVLERDAAGRYANTPETEFFLVRGRPSYVGGLLEMANASL